jgi:fatty acid/phospholipid biosynthesis enzyme
MSIAIAVDAMGGDRAPGVIVDGALDAVRRLGVRIILVGPVHRLRGELAQRDAEAEPGLEIADAPDVITMDESPLAALRRKPRASIRVAADLVAAGRADALFTAGHSGAAFLAAHAASASCPAWRARRSRSRSRRRPAPLCCSTSVRRSIAILTISWTSLSWASPMRR